MTETWKDMFGQLVAAAPFEMHERPGQTLLGEWVMYVTQASGTLLCEAPVGVGKSVSYSMPLIAAAKRGERSIISTETTALQDQLYEKDLPMLRAVLGKFKFHSLKGRNHYLCMNRAPKDHGIVLRLRTKDIGNGERRDCEKALGWRIDDDDWELISGNMDFCAQNKCDSEKCYSTRARKFALDADIVVTNHALLRTHADMYEDGMDGLLGDFKHLVVDEAHTLEKVLVDGWGEELAPYDLYKMKKAVWDASSEAMSVSVNVAQLDEAERMMKEGLKSIIKLFTKLAEKNLDGPIDEYEWKRQNFALSAQYLSGSQPHDVVMALEDYELQGPGRFKAASEAFAEFAKLMKMELESREKGTRKIRKGMTAAKKLSRLFDMMSEAIETRDGVVMRYGVPYAVICDGWKAWKGEFEVRIRCVPLDVSGRARDTIWNQVKSATLVSGTLRDETDGTFRYTIESLGLPADSHQIRVGSTFDYTSKQLVYVTPATDEPVGVVGARYSAEELRRVIDASQGRALVLFTAKAELEYAADYLRGLQARGEFPHRIFVQERGVQKQELVEGFLHDRDSVLLATKSFFTGVNFPGETCSIVVLAKFPLPQFNSLCRAQIAWWRGRGFPKWYDREALQVFKQANGRLIRNESDRGVIAILDQRVANPKENVSKLTGMEISATGSALTNNLDDVKRFLSA